MDHSAPKHKPIQLLASDADKEPAAERGQRLLELANTMDTSQPFHKHQLVRWKAGLKNRASPAYNEVAIVREVLAAPEYDTCEQGRCAGTPYFGEPLTLVLAILDGDGDFLEFRYDGRRFEAAGS